MKTYKRETGRKEEGRSRSGKGIREYKGDMNSSKYIICIFENDTNQLACIIHANKNFYKREIYQMYLKDTQIL